MSDNNTTPEVTTTSKMDIAKAKASAAKDATVSFAKGTAVPFLKRHPKLAAAVGVVAISAGYFAWPSHGTPVHQAGLTAAPSKTVQTGETATVEMVVGSYKKAGNLLILNNNRDYKVATMSVVLDLAAAPELAGVDPRSLRGQTIKAKGERQTYDGKPQIRVTRAKDLTIDPSAVVESQKKN